MKVTLEKKAKKKELAAQSASETEKSGSGKTPTPAPAPKEDVTSPDVRRRTEVTEKKEKKFKKQINNQLDNVNQNVVVDGEDLTDPKNGPGNY